MSLTINPRDDNKRFGKDRMWVGKITLDNSYPTNGYSIAGLAPNSKVVSMFAANGGGYIYEFDYDNQKLKVMQGNNDLGADGPAVEVGSGSNLASVVVEAAFLID